MSDFSLEGPDSTWPPQMRFKREVEVPWSLLAPFRLDTWGFPCCRRGLRHFRLKGRQTKRIRNWKEKKILLPAEGLKSDFNLMRIYWSPPQWSYLSYWLDPKTETCACASHTCSSRAAHRAGWALAEPASPGWRAGTGCGRWWCPSSLDERDLVLQVGME